MAPSPYGLSCWSLNLHQRGMIYFNNADIIFDFQLKSGIVSFSNEGGPVLLATNFNY